MTNPAQELQWAGASAQQRTHTPLHTLPLPPLQFGRFYAEMAQIIVESRQWKPEGLIDGFGALSTGGDVREQYSIERQRVMALLKRHQHAGTPKIHAFLSCDNYFFGTLRCQLIDVQRRERRNRSASNCKISIWWEYTDRRNYSPSTARKRL